MTITGIITAILIGIVVGVLGRLLVPGDQNSRGTKVCSCIGGRT